MTDANERSGVEVEYDPDRDYYVGSFERSDTDPSMAVVEAIAAVNHSDPLDLDPLYRSIDTDALDSILSNPHGTDVSVSFSIADLEVTVSCEGTIEIEPPELNVSDS